MHIISYIYLKFLVITKETCQSGDVSLTKTTLKKDDFEGGH